jgi:nicotinate-nucleotide--dimethylbenzimidazole phosphoribosyltransferase
VEVLEKIKNIKDINFEKQNEFQSKMNNIMKPIKSLGVLEKIGAQISGIKGNTKYSLKNRKHFVFASDNGVEKEGVSPCPREYTRLVSESMLGGTGAIRLLCNTYNVDFSLVDVGIDGDIKKEYENLIINKISKGTGNIRYEKAMELEAVYKVLDSSFKIVENSKDKYDILSCGEMGIGNTSTSGALIYKVLDENLDKIVGIGSGLSNNRLEHKKIVIKEACERVKSENIYEILSELGGYDIVAMTGFYLACAYYRIPVILDGYISLASALVAYKINPLVKNYMIPSHKTMEDGANLVYEYLNLIPFLNMEMCLGEGTGAVIVYPILDSIQNIYENMLTKEEIYKKYF